MPYSVHRRLLVLVTMAVLALVPTSVWAYRHLSWYTPDGRAIASTIRGAVSLEHKYDLPPARYRSGHIPHAVLAGEEWTAQREVGRYYAGSQLQFWSQTLDAMIAGQVHPLYPAWRNSQLTLDELSIYGASADATVESQSTAYDGEGRSAQASTWKESYHLVRGTSGWRIDEWTASCLDGCP